jgi:hypothetical protein
VEQSRLMSINKLPVTTTPLGQTPSGIFVEGSEKVPHELFNLGWDEWAAIIAIISGVFVGLNQMLKSFKNSIMDPFSEQMNILSKSIDKLTENSTHDHHVFDRRLDKHDNTLIRHEAEIGFLYEKNGLKRRENHED